MKTYIKVRNRKLVFNGPFIKVIGSGVIILSVVLCGIILALGGLVLAPFALLDACLGFKPKFEKP